MNDSNWSGEIVHSKMLGSDSYVYVEIGADESVVICKEGVTDRKTGERLAIVPDVTTIQ